MEDEDEEALQGIDNGKHPGKESGVAVDGEEA